MKQHALSQIFPAMPEDEIRSLADDIKAHGLKNAIVIYDGQILDGYHRFLACKIAGINPRTIDYNGKNPAALVKSANWHRRHMTASQRALAEVQLSEWASAGKQPKGAAAAPLQTVADMAKEASTGERTIQQAKRVEEKGTPALKEAVKEGALSVEKAEKIARKPKAKQAKAIKEAKEKKPRAAPKAKPEGDGLQQQYAALRKDYAELKEHCEELTDDLKTCQAVMGTDPALEMKKLREELRTCKRRRDELMASTAEMRKEINFWKGQAKKLGYKGKTRT